MIGLGDIKRAWNRFFFEPQSPLPMAVYRAVYGFVVLVNQAMLLPDVTVWFSERGVATQETALKLSGGGGLNLLRILPPGDASLWFLFVLSMLFAATLMVGFYTRLSALGVFLCLVTFSHRNTLILMSGDSFLRIGAFYLMFSHAGAALSLDRWLRQRRGLDEGPPALAAPWAQRLIQVQLSFLYFYAFVWKAMGSMWLQGTALYYTARLPEFWRFPVPYLLEHMWTIRLNTWGTLVVEFALAVLIWIKELRYPVLLAGVLLHAGIEYSMNIPLFGLVMVSAYITFIAPKDLERFLAWFSGKLRRVNPSSPRS